MSEVLAKTDVRFVAGVDRFTTCPAFVVRAALTHRLGVIQETAVAGCDEMYFDEALWRALIEFVLAYEPGDVTVMRDLKRAEASEIPLAAYLAEWEARAQDDRDPPPAMLLRVGGALRLCIVTDYWTQVGGPMPYHDSYTYSVFTDRDIGTELPGLLAAADRWTVDPAMQVVEAEAPVGWLGRLLRKVAM